MNKKEKRVVEERARKRRTPADASVALATTLFALDEHALDRARKSLDEGANTPSGPENREQIVKLLNDALATELVCVLRYKRHYHTAKGLRSAAIADEFLVHANDEAAHADRIANRIVQLGGDPGFAPNTLLARSHAHYDEPEDIPGMVRSNLIAERVAVEAYRQLIALIGPSDPTTRKLLEEILADEEEHADELSDWLTA
jgi:bacterioferritin